MLNSACNDDSITIVSGCQHPASKLPRLPHDSSRILNPVLNGTACATSVSSAATTFSITSEPTRISVPSSFLIAACYHSTTTEELKRGQLFITDPDEIDKDKIKLGIHSKLTSNIVHLIDLNQHFYHQIGHNTESSAGVYSWIW